MKISHAGLDLIKRWEGCRLKAYKDSVGVWTIGYGLTSAAGIVQVYEGMVISQAQADDYLARALVKYEQAVDKAITRPMTQPQFDSMTSLCYNIGPNAFANSSVVRRFNAGDIAGAGEAFLMWTKAGGKELQGLVNRRKDERAFFLRGAEAIQKPVEPVPPAPAPTPPPAPETPPAPLPETGRSIMAIIIGATGALIAAVFALFYGVAK